MRTWKPDPQRALQDRMALASGMQESIRGVARAFGSSIADGISATLPSNALSLLHPDIFAWYFSLTRHHQTGNAAALHAEADRWSEALESAAASRNRAASNKEALSLAIDITANDRGRDAFDRAIEAKHRSTGLDSRVDMVSTLTPAQQANVRRAAGFIERAWPEMFAEIGDHLQRIYFFDSKDFISFTDFDTHGAIFVRAEFIDDPVRLSEEIVHECSHIQLNTVMATTPLFTNSSDEVYSSPLRNDPRPMFGVYHQMYVLCRLAHYYGRLSSIVDCHQQHLEEKSQAQEAITVVRQHAKHTTAGQQLTDSMWGYLQS